MADHPEPTKSRQQEYNTEEHLSPRTMSNKHVSPLLPADSMSPVPEKKQSSFFKLPAELRNVIYEAVLLDHDLGHAFECFGGVTYVQHRPLHLFFVNKQIYQETRLLPYSLSSVTAGPRTRFQEWKARRTPDQLRAIARIHFVFDAYFFDHTSTEEGSQGPFCKFTSATNYAMTSLSTQHLFFPELSGLQHILIELRSYTSDGLVVIEQITMLQSLKRVVKELNPHANVHIELHFLGEKLRHDYYPSSSDTGIRMVRFGQTLEGRTFREIIEELDGDAPAISQDMHLLFTVPVNEWSSPLVAEQRGKWRCSVFHG
jgi:hypothetical protein